MMFVSFNSNTTGVTSGAGTAYPSGTPGFTSGAGTAYPSGANDFIPGFKLGSCYSIFSFLCGILDIIVCPFGH